MTEYYVCDICGRSAEDLFAEALNSPIKFIKDDDELWVCSECQSNTLAGLRPDLHITGVDTEANTLESASKRAT